MIHLSLEERMLYPPLSDKCVEMPMCLECFPLSLMCDQPDPFQSVSVHRKAMIQNC